MYKNVQKKWHLLKYDLSPKIYAILEGNEFSQLLGRGLTMLKSPIYAMQIRGKNLDRDQRKKLAVRLCQEAQHIPKKPLIIINDDIHLAKKLEVGIHLGQDDLSLGQARKILGKTWTIGISTHTFEQAMNAQKNGATYIGFGPIYPTKSKKNALPPRNPEELRKILKHVSIPVVAIGGLTPDNINPLLEMGIKHLAFLSALQKENFFEKISEMENV